MTFLYLHLYLSSLLSSYLPRVTSKDACHGDVLRRASGNFPREARSADAMRSANPGTALTQGGHRVPQTPVILSVLRL